MKIVAVSGGFDPVHFAHVSMFKEAAKYGSVVAILNSDAWLIRKKGYCFMPFEERKAIIESCRYISSVISVDDADGSVCSALEELKPDYFANGGDRKEDNVPEVEVCKRLNIEMIWNVGGEKLQSSSELIKKAMSGYLKNLLRDVKV